MTVPAIDFAAVRREIELPAGDILLAMADWPEERRKKALQIIESHEIAAVAEIQAGCADFLRKLRSHGSKLAILTRNSQKSVDAFLDIIEIPFDAILTREHTHVKPSPVPVLDLLREVNVTPSDALTVGDYIHDLESGNSAGTATCFFQNPGTTSFAQFADFTVNSYSELDEFVF